jgi:RNA polymerase sigma-70 factor (ECF subfamily)
VDPYLAGRSQAVTGFERELVAARGRLFCYAMKLTRNRDDAEDLVQDVMVKAVRSQSSFEPGTNMGAWLNTIALRTLINSKRRDRIHREAVDTESDSAWTGEATRRPALDSEATAVGTFRSEVREKILGLPKEYAEVLAMVDLEGLRYVEAAASAGCPLGTVMSRLHRGRKLLAERMAA